MRLPRMARNEETRIGSLKVRDKNLKVDVNVLDKNCPGEKCYWPRMDPGVFVQGQGYRARSKNWLCGTREVRGCPDNPIRKKEEKNEI